MAKTRLSEKALYVDRGYGQIEPNHLSARRNGKIYAQLPAAKTIDILENGQFVKYDYAKGEVNFTGPGPWMLVFNEPKVYEDRQTNADFAMKREDYSAYIYNAANDAMPEGTVMVPRVMNTDGGDIYTTNCVAEATLAVEDLLTPGEDGYLKKAASAEGLDMVWQVAKVYTMPDEQKGVKLIRIK